MSARLFTACACVIIGIGCHKPSVPATSESTALPATAIKPEAAADEAQALAALDGMTQAVRKYAAEQQRVPKSIDEVVAAGYLSTIPAAPAGKKFAINKNLQIYLTP